MKPLAVLVGEARRALSMSQEQMGNRFVASRKTAGRWEAGQASPGKATLCDIARAVHQFDPELAAALAAHAGATLESLGLVKPAPPPEPPPPAGPIVDSVVCAAADAMDVLPRVVRPAVYAAFRRVRELGLAVLAVERALAPEEKAKRR